MGDESIEIIPKGLTGGLGAAQVDHSGSDNDAQLIDLWLSSKRSKNTRRAYLSDVLPFISFLQARGKTLKTTKVVDVRDWSEQLEGAASTRSRKVSAIKSLLTFGHRTGYLMYNVGGVITTPTVPNELAQRILNPRELRSLLRAAEGRSRVLLRFLYASGARVSEACSLRWKHVVEKQDGSAIVALTGKGGKTRHVPVSSQVVKVLKTLRSPDTKPDDPIFITRTGKQLHTSYTRKAIKRLAEKAGIEKPVSPHWFRHAHASHALEGGAPIHLVQATLGHASVATTGKYLHINPNDGSGRYLSEFGDD